MSKDLPASTLHHSKQDLALLVLVLVILIGLNLRPFLTAIGPLAQAIDNRLGLGMDTLAWLTLLPLWLIGVGVLITPGLRRLTGPSQLLGAALLLLGMGNAMRFVASARRWCKGCYPALSSRASPTRCHW